MTRTPLIQRDILFVETLGWVLTDICDVTRLSPRARLIRREIIMNDDSIQILERRLQQSLVREEQLRLKISKLYREVEELKKK